ncbi:MAG: hypothetical protein JXA99_00295 [Candidatus Lokiarchaeota archaeon]|nr:hypothetical protein [Candidatus Lokiarchaeota archaeon]
MSTKKEKLEDKQNSETTPIYVKVSNETRDIIDKYKDEGKTISYIIGEAIDLYDSIKSLSPEIAGIIEKYKNKYKTETKLFENAIKLLDKHENLERSEDIDLWCRARDELQMMLIGKTTFNQLLTAAETPEESLDKPMKRNIALGVILWVTGKPINALSLEEIIQAIKKMWIVANYFYFVDVKKLANDQYHVVCKHHENKRYSNYWLGYFKELFLSNDLPFKCSVEGQAFDETLSLTIKKLFQKKNEK